MIINKFKLYRVKFEIKCFIFILEVRNLFSLYYAGTHGTQAYAFDVNSKT